MPKNTISSFEKKVSEELMQLGYSCEITSNFFNVYKKENNGNLAMLVSIEKRFYYVRIYTGMFITLNVINIFNRLLTHYKKQNEKEFKR